MNINNYKDFISLYPELSECDEFKRLSKKGREYKKRSSKPKDILIHKEALDASLFIYESFIENKVNKQYMIFAETQAGKTGVMTTTPVIFKDKIENEECNLDVESDNIKIWLFGPSPKDLKRQTIKRFKKTGLNEFLSHDFGEYRYVTPSTLNSRSRNKEKLLKLLKKDREENSLIFFMFDEAHENSGLDSSGFYQRIEEFVAEGNIPLMGKISQRPALEIGIHITATPAHLAEVYKNKGSSEKFELVMLKPGIGYKGIYHLYNEEKLLDSKYSLNDLISCKDKTVKYNTEFFFEKIFKDAIQSNLRNNRCGYIILRSRKSDSLKKVIEKLISDYSSFTDVLLYDANNDNIGDLNKKLSTKCCKNLTSFILVKEGLGRGITIDNKENIQICYETRSNDASTIQSLPGRLSGYNTKTHPDLKVYTDLSSIKNNIGWLEIYNRDDLENKSQKELNSLIKEYIMSGKLMMSSTHNKYKSKRTIEIYDEVFKTEEEARDYCIKNWPNYLKEGKRHSISHCSANNKEDIAEGILNKRQMNLAGGTLNIKDTNVNYRLSIIHMDGPNKKFKESWNSLSKELSFMFIVRKYEASVSKEGKSNISWDVALNPV